MLASLLGIRVPLQSHPLQALVSELLEPVHPTVVMSNAVHVYVSQAHKGELVMGAGDRLLQRLRPARRVPRHRAPDGRRGRALPGVRARAPAAHLGRHRRRRARTPRRSSGRTPYENLYLNCGWGTGGFKATPGVGWCLAHTIAHGEPHPYVAPFSLDRFVTGALVDEHGAAAVAH